MKIKEIQVDGFGVWGRLPLENLSDDITVFYGPNEAGKSTLMQFARAILYGFSPERRRRYLPPIHGGRGGGWLTVSSLQGKAEIRRAIDDGDQGRGAVQVVSPDGTQQGQHALSLLLAGVDEAIYSNVFAIGLEEIQQLATLNDTDAAHHLYALAGGLDRVSLVQVTRELAAARSQLLSDNERTSQIPDLVARRHRLSAELAEISSQTSRWTELANRRGEIDDESARREQEIRHLQAEIAAIDMAVKVRDRWLSRADYSERIRRLGPVPEVPLKDVARLDKLNELIEQRELQAGGVKQRWQLLASEAKALPINMGVWKHHCRIKGLGEQRDWICSLEKQTGQLKEEIEELQLELQGEQEQLGFRDNGTGNMPDLSERMLNSLRGPAATMREEKERLDRYRSEFEEHNQDAAKLAEELTKRLHSRRETDLTVAIEKSGERVSALRKRLQMDERIEQLVRHREQLDEHSQLFYEDQALSKVALFGLGGMFIVGFAFLLVGVTSIVTGGASVFGATAWMGFMMSLLGLFMILGTPMAKSVLERHAIGRYETSQRQTDQLGVQLEQLRREREELDAQLPRGGGPIALRLQTAERELADLEELMPLDARRQAALAENKNTKREAKEARDNLKLARRRWQDALRVAGLPSTISPSQLKKMARHRDTIQALQQRLAGRRQELEARTKELGAATDRILSVSADVGLEPQGDRAMILLHQLCDQLGRQEQLIQRRRELGREGREQRKEYRRVRRSLDRLRQRRKDLLSGAKVASEEEFRRLATRLAKYRELKGKHDELDANIRGLIDSPAMMEAVGVQLERGQEDMKRHSTEVRKKLADAEQRLLELHERRGRLIEQMRGLAEDRRLGALQLELSAVETRLTELARRWQVLGAITVVLERVRKLYETHRQPQALAEASEYMVQLTGGRYTRIWSPLGESELKVDDDQGRSLTLEVLSRGTREQVLLALRMSLAATFARRGAKLPMVLDDVLVNFDVQRAKAAAAVLRDFARQGHQLLVFTCHEHIMELFRKQQVDVRRLPVRDGLRATELEVEEEEELIEEEVFAEIEAPVEEEVEEEVEAEIEEEEYEEEVAEETEPEEEEEYEEEVAEEDEEEYEEETDELEDELEDEVDEVEEEVEEAINPEPDWEEEEPADWWDEAGAEPAGALEVYSEWDDDREEAA